MHPSDVMNVLTAVSAISLAVTVGRSNIKRQTIADLVSSNSALKERVEILEAEVANKNEQIQDLRETIDGYTKLVREGALAGLDGARSGNGSTHPKTTKNRGS